MQNIQFCINSIADTAVLVDRIPASHRTTDTFILSARMYNSSSKYPIIVMNKNGMIRLAIEDYAAQAFIREGLKFTARNDNDWVVAVDFPEPDNAEEFHTYTSRAYNFEFILKPGQRYSLLGQESVDIKIKVMVPEQSQYRAVAYEWYAACIGNEGYIRMYQNIDRDIGLKVNRFGQLLIQ